ncbi:hypothetical protein O3M35_009543 [Rhynocoris fuscipes]|uniref:Uncharacterized protein n=1 Tax=Rhynocoris fuscipes TaxID=488301 RepID=A0AAW1D4R6_9HEMI
MYLIRITHERLKCVTGLIVTICDRPDQFGESSGYSRGNEQEGNEDVGIEGISEEEFQALDSLLDQLNLALDDWEQKNESVRIQLIELLNSIKNDRS